MPKKTAAKKSTSAFASPLETLVAHLRQVADQIEKRLPIVDEQKLSAALGQLKEQVAAVEAAVERAVIVPLDEFERLQPAWAEAWQLAKDSLVEQAVGLVGSAVKKERGEKDPVHRQRVLMLLLKQKGGPAARSLLEDSKAQWRKQQEQQTAQPRHVTDQEATKALQAWGQLTEDTFLAGFDNLDKSIISRSAELVGLKLARNISAKNKKDLFKAAKRFYSNTQF